MSIANSENLTEQQIVDLLNNYNKENGIFIAPNIPEKKLKNALAKCKLDPDKHIIALIDCTVFGSAKNALLFGRNGIHFHNDPAIAYPEIGKISYPDLGKNRISLTKKKLIFAQGIALDLSGSAFPVDKLLTIFRLITGQEESEIGTAEPARVEAPLLQDVVFRPLEAIRFPSTCIGCMKPDPEKRVVVATDVFARAGKAEMMGSMMGGIAGSLIATTASMAKQSLSKETMEYSIPICPVCLSKLSQEEIRILGTSVLPLHALDGTNTTCKTDFFSRTLKKGFFHFHISNPEYAAEFCKLNQELIFENEKNCMKNKKISLPPPPIEPLLDGTIPLSMQIIALSDKLLLPQPDAKWYKAPEIPIDKLNKAIKTYGKSAQAKDVIALGDSTTFGSGKKGFFITSEAVYYRESTLELPVVVRFDEISRSEMVGGFPSYAIQLSRFDASPIKIDCVLFDSMRDKINEFFNQIAAYNRNKNAEKQK